MIDCFCFFNEFALLELRLEMLWDVVDHFVIVESTTTFSNKPKPLYFLDNKDRFEKYLSKITHVVSNPVAHGSMRWANEISQRNAIWNGLNKLSLSDDDIVLISDVDEIPRLEYLKEAQVHLRSYNSVIYAPRLYYYFYNLEYEYNDQSWGSQMQFGTRAVTWKTLQTCTPEEIRRSLDGLVLTDGGWHFSFLGGLDSIVDKLKSFSHTEYSNDQFTDLEHIKTCLRNGEDILKRGIRFVKSPDDRLPHIIRANKEKYKEFLI